ncbi:MAG: phosphoribosylformylglycinamidine cyclo-ligase [Campylobacterales bacterium]
MMLSYKDSGVDIDAGNALVKDIAPLVKKTFSKNVLGGIGSFAGAYELPSGYRNPVLLSATDGVGTKLKVAIEAKRLDTIGIDLVAMCVNDLICNFAEPLYFLDYYATGKLVVDEAKRVIAGISDGCIEAECSLIGGESAEMPGIYSEGDFDLAGFAVGIAEKEELLKGSSVKEGDILVGFASSGLHSNGYSLARKLLFDRLGMKLESIIEDKKQLVDILLEPTNIYVKMFKKHKNAIKALAHITGGGLPENLPRILEDGFGARIEAASIPKQAIFSIMGEYVESSEMYRTFNMGVGLVCVCAKEDADRLVQEGGFVMGEITTKEGVEIV